MFGMNDGFLSKIQKTWSGLELMVKVHLSLIEAMSASVINVFSYVKGFSGLV